MKYSIKVNEVRAKDGSNIKGFATVVFGDSFKITNIAILENKEKGELFVSMPRYRSNERDEKNSVIYKDVCNPITAEFREELYTNSPFCITASSVSPDTDIPCCVKKATLRSSHPGIGLVCTNATFAATASVEVSPPGLVNRISAAAM